MEIEVQLMKEALGLSKDALTVVIAIIGIYSSLGLRRSKGAPQGESSAAKLGIEIPGIGALFWKRG